MIALTLLVGLLAAVPGMWLDVPFVSQPENGCGSAVVWMVMRYWSAGPDFDEIHRELYSRERGGVSTADMERFFQRHDFSTYAFRGEMTDLEHHLAKGRPIIVGLKSRSNTAIAHFVAVTGFDGDDDVVLVNDPAGRKLQKMDRQDFAHQWQSADNWTLLAVPKTSEAAQERSIELAGAGFRAGNYREARSQIQQALQVDPADAYSNEFIATLYLLQNNPEAALKYWNRIGGPRIENIRTEPPVPIDPILWDRSFAFSRASVVSLADFESTKARLNSLDLFSRTRFEFVPVDDGFDLVVHPLMKSGIGSGRVATMSGLVQGLPYKTIQYDTYNIRSDGINASTLARWDSQKRRLWARVAGPIQRNPQRRFEFTVDGRDETWMLAPDEFRVRKVTASAGIESEINARWSWASRVRAYYRRPHSLLTYEASVRHRVLSFPERRLTLDAAANVEFGKNFTKATSMVGLQWLPSATGDDYKTTITLQGGKAGRGVPIDEAFALGLDRDHEFLLRGHSGTRDGRKGAGPIGRDFALLNVELQKNAVSQGLFKLSAGPFVDVVRTASAESILVDAGIQVRLSLLTGVNLNFSYGRDLRDGRGAFFYRRH